jgi:hypothetical protein
MREERADELNKREYGDFRQDHHKLPDAVFV